MASHNTLYIAEPIYSEKLQKFDSEATFPPIKKIGITTDAPDRREKELLGTVSPVKISIVKSWTGIDAKKIESMLHAVLDNTRLDGEYFWDGNETLVESVSDFIATYHPEANEIEVSDDEDVKAAENVVESKHSQRIYSDVVPALDGAGIEYKLAKRKGGAIVKLGDYTIRIGARNSGRYTFTIFSNTRSTEDALNDFPGAIGLSANGSGETDRKARMPMVKLDVVIDSLKVYKEKLR